MNKKQLRIKRDLQFLEDVLKTIQNEALTVQTKYLHPTGMLPVPPFGFRIPVTEVEVQEQNGKYIQQIKPEMADAIVLNYEQIKSMLQLGL